MPQLCLRPWWLLNDGYIDPPRATGISVVRVLWLQISIKMWKGAALVGFIRGSDNIVLFVDYSCSTWLTLTGRN